MHTINAVSNYNNQLNTRGVEVIDQSDIGSLDKNAFLKIFLTQLNNQDPTSPMDSSEMVAQLAQFSTIESLASIDSKMDELSNNISTKLDSISQAINKLSINNNSLAESTDSNEISNSNDKSSYENQIKELITNNLDSLSSIEINSQVNTSDAQDFLNKLLAENKSSYTY